MQRMLFAFAVALCCLTATAPAQAQPAGTVTVAVTNHPTHGRILTDGRGMTLYLFSNDTKGTSNCYDTCQTRWPMLKATAGTPPTGTQDIGGRLGTVTRRDGGVQVTYNDIPLYYWAQDEKAGDAKGQGVGGNWWIVPVGTTEITPAAPAQPAAPAAPGAAAGTTAGPIAQASPVAQPSPAAKPSGATPAALPRSGDAPSVPFGLLLLLGVVGALLTLSGLVVLRRGWRHGA